MWPKIASFIPKNRIPLLVLLVIATAFMGYHGSRISLSYEMARVLPADDPDLQAYGAFKKTFGEDGSVMVIGVETDSMYALPFFRDWYELNRSVGKLTGIKTVVSNVALYTILRNDSLDRFSFQPIFSSLPRSQSELDSLQTVVTSLPFYEGIIYTKGSPAHLMAITFDNQVLNSKNRIAIVNQIKQRADVFGRAHALTMHYSGLPYIRTAFSAKVAQEMKLFSLLALAVTAAILLLFFRSPQVVIFSMLIVAVGVVWSVGTIVLFGYRITLLSGLIPPLIIVIGIPNTIFLLNRYQQEYARHGNQPEALFEAVRTTGPTLFLANVITAIGFGVFYFTGSSLLMEFGLVAAINVMVTFFISLIFVPVIFSYLPPPSLRSIQHLDSRLVTNLLRKVDYLVHHRRMATYTVVAAVIAVSVWGILKIKVVGYVVDDLPKNDPIYTDLKFFEKHIKGVMPFEVSIDTRRAGGVLNPGTLVKIRVLQREMSKYTEFSRPLSVVEAVKFFYQAYRGGAPRFYVLPPALELNKLARYTEGVQGNDNRLQAFLDSTRRYTRVSFQMADVGSVRTTELFRTIGPKADSIFNYDAEEGKMLPDDQRYGVSITGNSVIFAKGNDYLLDNLRESLLMAIVLICLVRAFQFPSLRMIAISLPPSIIPLLITAGIMGYVGIALKPSTILIFSIAFGIASDGTIYFMTRYKQELATPGRSVSEAISNTIAKTGISMLYTAVILFAGFAIFAASSFQGTAALGILISITLLIAMFSNLVLLPTFLLSMEKNALHKAARKV